MRRLPGPAIRRLSEGDQTQRLSPNCFGTGSEHKLNLLCGLFGALDSKWMSGSASRNHQPRGTVALGGALIRPTARSPERAKDTSCFSLDRDLHGCRLLVSNAVVTDELVRVQGSLSGNANRVRRRRPSASGSG